MRRILVAAVLAGVVFAATASASSKQTVVMKMGDAIDVVGTPIACFAITSNGKAGVACVLWANGKPKVGTFGAGLATDGTAVINKIAKDGSGTNVWKRKLASASTVYRVKTGDEFGLVLPKSIDLGCRVINVTSSALAERYRGVKVSCWRAKGSAPLKNTYGVSISAKIAGVFRFDAGGQIMRWGVERMQPK